MISSCFVWSMVADRNFKWQVAGFVERTHCLYDAISEIHIFSFAQESSLTEKNPFNSRQRS